jgi:hypothetical protein
MDLRQMEYLLAVAEERHFTRAAELAGISQSGLSAAIRSLEEARVGSAVAISAAGSDSHNCNSVLVTLWPLPRRLVHPVGKGYRYMASRLPVGCEGVAVTIRQSGHRDWAFGPGGGLASAPCVGRVVGGHRIPGDRAATVADRDGERHRRRGVAGRGGADGRRIRRCLGVADDDLAVSAIRSVDDGRGRGRGGHITDPPPPYRLPHLEASCRCRRDRLRPLYRRTSNAIHASWGCAGRAASGADNVRACTAAPSPSPSVTGR